MTALTKAIALLSFLIFTQASIAVEQAESSENKPKTLEELKVAIEKIRHDTNTPAVGIALVDKDGPYWVAGLGETDIEKHIEADENSMFRIGSVSKMFVALSVLKLVEERKLHLTDEVHYLAPEIKFENKWEKTNPVLLVHLLEHTTGWDEWSPAEFAYDAPDSLSLEEALGYRPSSRKSRWVPGTRYAYTNLGPAVAAYIIEKVSGQKFEDYVRDNFFHSLDMPNATYYESDTYKKLATVLYTNNQPERYFHNIYRPVGSINVSAKEMANLLQLFVQHGKFNGTRVLTNESILRMERPKSTLGAEQGIIAGYGLHNETSGFADYGVAFHGHEGYVPGAFTELRYNQELQIGFVVMTSSANQSTYQISELIKSYLLKNIEKKALNAVDLSLKFKNAAGIYVPINPRGEVTRYETDISNAIKISVSDNKIHRSPLFGGWESNDYAIAENLLVNPWSGLPSIAFVNDPLAGEALQIEGNLYKKASPILIYGKVTFLLAFIVLMLINIIFAFVWIPRWLTGRLSGTTVNIRIFPMLATITILTAFFACQLIGVTWRQQGTINTGTLTVYICAMLYPLLTAVSLISSYYYRNEPIKRLIYWDATILAIFHALFVLYLAYYGMIPYSSWRY